MDQEKLNNKYDTAIGIWKVPCTEFEINYTVKDFRKLKKLIFKKREDKSEMFDDLADYITEELVPKYFPETKDHNSKIYKDLVITIENNIMYIFEIVMIDFKFTTKEKMEEAEKKVLKNL